MKSIDYELRNSQAATLTGQEDELQSGALFDWAVRAYHNC